MTTNSKTTVAIIGTGKIGTAIATNLIKSNHPVILAARDLTKAKALAQKLGPLATVKDIPGAIKEADVVIPAIWFAAIKDFIGTYAAQLQGKTLIDVSNPIGPDGNGGFKKVIAENESAGQILSYLLPANARFIKAFGTLGAASLEKEAFRKPAAVLFYASDNVTVNGQAEELIRSSGFEPVNIGGIDQSLRIEVFGDLHEFGGLGKTVSAIEAKKYVNSPASL